MRHPLRLAWLLLLTMVVGSHVPTPRPLAADVAATFASAAASTDPDATGRPAGEPLQALRDAACRSATLAGLASRAGAQACAEPDGAPTISAPRRLSASPSFGAHGVQRASSPGDGQLVDRQRILTIGPVALDLVAYVSSGLVVGGLLCYVDDGQPRSTILHLHGGLGGIFLNPDGGDIVGTCYSWAANHGRNAFVPTFRGQDGSQGQPELCLGEADDVASAAILLRSLEIVDPNRLALIGGSMGGCVALKAGVMIPDLRAVLAIAPPTDWAAMVSFHRTQFAPAMETRCDGSSLPWTAGGPVFADTLDSMICGHIGCSTEQYDIRSPIPLVYQSTNPTLVVSASSDNLVPVFQQVLWSILRSGATGMLALDIRDRCSAPAAPALAQDALIFVPGAYHLMENGPVVSGLLWVLEQLDAPLPPPAAGS